MTSAAPTGNPYPGPRAFETAERGLFFGRDREAPEVCSLLIAHRALLLYAQSGAGKTSLLRAALLPMLDREGFDVLPIARVQGIKPADFESTHAPNVFACNVLSGWAGSELNTDTMRAASIGEFLSRRPRRTDKRGEVLPRIAIFDQFEELFTAYPQYWQQRGEFLRQLNEAAQADPLLRLLFVMREDYVASLDPYLDLLPEQLATRYRLERLDSAAAQRAVEGPLRDSGRTYSAGVGKMLVEHLLTVRVQDPTGSEAKVREQYAEPVQLQVVCRNLWEKLPAEVRTIDAKHVQTFGDVDQALTEFYERAISEAVSQSGLAEGRLREFFSRQLITPAGTRGVVFQERDSTGGIPNTVIRVLEDKHHIVRADTRLGARWYELTHDRLIEPIRKSNEGWERSDALRRNRHRLRRRTAAVLAISAVALTAGWQVQTWLIERELKERQVQLERALKEREMQREYEIRSETAIQRAKQEMDLERKAEGVRKEQEEAIRLAREQEERRALTIGQVEKLLSPDLSKHNKEAILDSVALYLWNRRDDRELQRVLRTARIPNRYGVDESSLPTLIEAQDHWPLELHFNPINEIDPWMLNYHWRTLAKFLAESWGVPVPSRLKLIEDPSLPVHGFRLLSKAAQGEGPQFRFFLTSRPEAVAVEDPGPDPRKQRVKKFLMDHNLGRIEINSQKIRRTYYWAPDWTQSIWRVGEHASFSREGLIALVAAGGMLETPELLITPEAAVQMLKRVAQRRPKTVEEVLAARGGIAGLVVDLREIVRSDSGTVHLDFLLDILANFPGRSREDVELAVDSQSAHAPPFPVRLVGPRGSGVVGLVESLRMESERQRPYEDTSTWLPALESPMRVLMGRAVSDRLAPGSALAPPLTEALTEMRGSMNRRFGFTPPAVRFRERGDLRDNQFSVEILNQTRRDEDAKPVEAPPDAVLDKVLSKLEFAYIAARVWWLDTDTVHRMIQHDVPERLREWLLERYSLTDLKVLLQAQIAPEQRERDAYVAGRDAEGYRSIRVEQSLRNLPWLLGSLVFRANTGADMSQHAATVDWLRRVQRYDAAGRTGKQAGGTAADLVRKGIDRLGADDISGASEAFTAAIAGNRSVAVESFLSLHAERVGIDTRLARIEGQCKLPAVGRVAKAAAPGIELRYEIESLLEKGLATATPEMRRRLELCLLWSYVAERHASKARAMIEKLDAQSANGDWDAKDEYLLAGFILNLHGTSMAEPARMGMVRRLLSHSLPRLSVQDADAAYLELVDRYKQGRSPIWHVNLLLSLSDTSPESFWIPYRTGERLSRGIGSKDGITALALLDKAAGRLPAQKADQQPRLHAWIDLAKAQAWLRILEDRPGDPKARGQIEAIAASLETRRERSWPSPDDVAIVLLSTYYYVDELPKAAKIAEDWVARAPEDAAARNHLVFIRLAKLDMRDALRLARSGVKKGEGRETDDETRFQVAMLELVSGSPTYEASAREYLVRTLHEYRDYVRMLLYWRLQLEGRDQHARAVLTERWAKIDRNSWQERLGQGDVEVWREMLIGYYLGNVERQRLFESLSDPVMFGKSPMSRLGMSQADILAEAHFYDALLQEVSGAGGSRRSRSNSALANATKSKLLNVYEYHLARYLLSQRAD